MNDMEDTGISLADLADLDVSDIKEVRFASLPAGIFDFKVLSGELDQGMNRDDEKRFIVEWKFEVLECVALLEKGVGNKEDFIGKNHTEKQYIVPSKAEEGIGLIRSFITDMGLDSAGPLGGMVREGKNPGIIESAIGHIFRGKIVRQPDKNDKSIIYSRMKLDEKKPAK